MPPVSRKPTRPTTLYYDRYKGNQLPLSSTSGDFKGKLTGLYVAYIHLSEFRQYLPHAQLLSPLLFKLFELFLPKVNLIDTDDIRATQVLRIEDADQNGKK